MSSLFLNTQTMFYSTLSLPKNTTQVYIKWRLSHTQETCMWQLPNAQYHSAHPPHETSFTTQWTPSKNGNLFLFSTKGFFKLCYSCLFSPKGVAVQGVRAEGWGMELAALPQMERDAANPVFAFLMPHLPLCQLRFKYFTLFPICTYHCFLLDFQGEHSLAFEILNS